MRRREETEPIPSPAPKVITIVEMITVKELSEQAGTSTGEIIKVLTGMGITATANQYLSPELATRVALEFGCAVEVTPFEEVQESAAEVGDPISLAPPGPAVPGTAPDGKPPPVEEHLPVSKVLKISEMVTVKGAQRAGQHRPRRNHQGFDEDRGHGHRQPGPESRAGRAGRPRVRLHRRGDPL